ncbi:MAG: HD domain-containing protein [Clostridiales bacterium]|nr:HD domain-containing protein [Clostridiales bacterium]
MSSKEFLNNILISDNVVYEIRANLQDLTLIIPEISDMIGFEHKHPHHNLDVWEHTLYALSLSTNNFDIRLALLLHDIGKPHSFQEGEVRHFKGHPEMSAHITKQILKRLDYNEQYIDFICEIVNRHDTPLTKEDIFSNTSLSKIIFEVQKCDVFAHNPTKNKKRLEYIENMRMLFNEKDILNDSVSTM